MGSSWGPCCRRGVAASAWQPAPRGLGSPCHANQPCLCSACILSLSRGAPQPWAPPAQGAGALSSCPKHSILAFRGLASHPAFELRSHSGPHAGLRSSVHAAVFRLCADYTEMLREYRLHGR